MKVLVVGCGSIGRRHIYNLIKLDNIKDILVYTKNKLCYEDIDNKDKISTIDSLNNIYVDFAVIANDTAKHIDTAIELATKGTNLFIEKPLSQNLEKTDILSDIVEKKRLKVFVAYNMRFLGSLQYLKKQMDENIIGDRYFAKIEVGQYLPTWRPDRDYRILYSASKKKGGGAALDLSHEIDYMRYLFGEPCSWNIFKTKVSNLEIDSDDLFEGIYVFPDNFVCNVHMDYLQTEKKREIRIVGSEATLICDFISGQIKVMGNNKNIEINDEWMFDMDKTYIDELTHFIDVINKDKEPAVTLEDGIKVLRLLEDGNV